jgi:DNA-binding transcriptional MerR regulator
MSKPLDTPQRYSLDELAALVDLPRRSIRYYVQIGLVDRPTGHTRADYDTNTHAEQLIAVRKWSASGLSLDWIRELLRGADAPAPARPRGPGTVEVWSHLVIADGVELTIALALVLLGFALGAETDLMSYLTSRYFEREHFGATIGWLYAVFGIAAATGAPLMGASFDATGSYGAGLAGLGAGLAIAALLVLRLRPYAYPPKHEAAS